MKKNSYGTILWIISRYLNGIYAKCHTILEQLFTVSKPFLKSWLLKSTLFKWIHMKKAAIPDFGSIKEEKRSNWAKKCSIGA